MPKENINRIKEATLLLCFLFLLFSFSGRSHTKQSDVTSCKTELQAFSKNNIAVISQVNYAPVLSSAKILAIPAWVNPEKHRLLIENRKIQSQISLSARHQPLIRSGISSGFYYLLFSIKGDESPA